MILNLRYTLSIEQRHSKVVIPFARLIGIWISEWDRNQLPFNMFSVRQKRRDALFTSLCCFDYKVFTQIEFGVVAMRWISVITVHFIALCIQIAKVDSHNEHFQDRCSSYMYGIRMVRIHLTTRESGTKHGQATRTSFIREFVLVQQIHTVHTNSLMKPVRIAWHVLSQILLSLNAFWHNANVDWSLWVCVNLTCSRLMTFSHCSV